MEEYVKSSLYNSRVIIHIKVFTLSRLHLEKTLVVVSISVQNGGITGHLSYQKLQAIQE